MEKKTKALAAIAAGALAIGIAYTIYKKKKQEAQA